MKFNLILNVLIILVSLFTAYIVYYIYNKKNVEKTFTGLNPDVRDRILNDLDILKGMNKSSSSAAVTQRNAIMKYIVKNFDDLHKDCTNKEKIDPVVQYKCGLGTKLINNTCEINWGPETVSVVSKQWDNSRIEKKIYVDLQRHIKYHNEVPRGFKANFDIFPNPNARRC